MALAGLDSPTELRSLHRTSVFNLHFELLVDVFEVLNYSLSAIIWYRRRDSNPQQVGSKPTATASCATPTSTRCFSILNGGSLLLLAPLVDPVGLEPTTFSV